MLNREIIIFDFETNGFSGTSVLSLSAIKAKVIENGLEEIERFNRFYYRTPGEIENKSAIEINSLTSDKIKFFRNNAEYPLYYVDDIASFIEFCGDTDHFIAHNFSFDRDFVGFETSISFCTFIECTKINIGKNNKLSDLAKYYGIPVDFSNLHNSMYDVEILYSIVEKMYLSGNENIIKFFNERPLNKKEQKYIQSRLNSYLKNKKEQKERFEKLEKNILLKHKALKENILKLHFHSSSITISQFLYSVNQILESLSLEPLTAVKFNNFLKKQGILSNKNKTTCLGPNSENFGIYIEERTSQDGNNYSVILYNNKGKETLKKQFLLFYLEK